MHSCQSATPPHIGTGPTQPLPEQAFVSVGTWLGFVGLFVQVVGRVLASIPPIGITDPHLETHPWDVHVHALESSH